MEASLQVCYLASSANPMNKSNSLDIYHSEIDEIKIGTSIRPKRQKIKKKKMYTNYTYVQEVTQGDPPTSNTY